MQSNQNKADNSYEAVNKNEKFINHETNENLSYLYPNGHRMTHQMRWFKGSKNRGLKTDIAA